MQDRRRHAAAPAGGEHPQGHDLHHPDLEDRAQQRRDRRRLQDAGEEGRDPGQPLLLQGQAQAQDRLRAAQGQLGPRAEPPTPGQIHLSLSSISFFFSLAVQIDRSHGASRVTLRRHLASHNINVIHDRCGWRSTNLFNTFLHPIDQY